MVAAFAQDPSSSRPPGSAPLPDAPSASTTQQTEPQGKTAEEKQIEKQEQSKRILGVVPRFGTTDRHDASALTAGEKFHIFRKSAFDPVTFVLIAGQAGISQAEDEFSGYGQGAEGYAKRFGATFADSTSSGFFSNFLYPVVFKVDPRYFRLGEGSISRRMGHAVKEEFVCHTDRGTRQFSYNNVLGAFTSGAISNLYYPSSDRGATLTLTRSLISLGYGTFGGLFDEFWPDIAQKVFRRKY
jgi:hypothetical protein